MLFFALTPASTQPASHYHQNVLFLQGCPSPQSTSHVLPRVPISLLADAYGRGAPALVFLPPLDATAVTPPPLRSSRLCGSSILLISEVFFRGLSFSDEFFLLGFAQNVEFCINYWIFSSFLSFLLLRFLVGFPRD